MDWEEQVITKNATPQLKWTRFHDVPTSEGPVTVDVAVAPDPSGRTAIYGLAADMPLTTRMLAALPLGDLKRAAAVEVTEKPPSLARVPKRDRHGDEFLSKVAEIARASVSREIAYEQIGHACAVSVGQAKRYVERAREAGFDTTGGVKRFCQGCGSDRDQQLIAPHPAGGWWHSDACMPPPGWTAPRHRVHELVEEMEREGRA